MKRLLAIALLAGLATTLSGCGDTCPKGEVLRAEFLYFLPVYNGTTTTLIPQYRYFCEGETK